MTHQTAKQTQKTKDTKRSCFSIGKYNSKKYKLTRDLSDNTMIYQGIRLPCKNDQGYCDPTTRTQATIVWVPRRHMYNISSSKNTRSYDKSSRKIFYTIKTI